MAIIFISLKLYYPNAPSFTLDKSHLTRTKKETPIMAGLVSLIVALLSLLLGIASAQQSCSNNLSVTYPAPVAASGWQFRLVANGFTRPRGIAFDSDGGLLVVESGAGLTHLTLDDEGGTCLTVKSKKRLIADENVSFSIW